MNKKSYVKYLKPRTVFLIGSILLMINMANMNDTKMALYRCFVILGIEVLLSVLYFKFKYDLKKGGPNY